MILINGVDITSTLTFSVNNILSNLLSSINDNVLEWLDKLVFIDTNITKTVIYVIGNNSYSGINLICNSLIYGFLIYYAISYLLSHLTFSQVERPFQFIFKLLLCAIALNSSEIICSSLIFIFSHISNMICELGNYLFNFDISFAGFIEDVLPNNYFASDSYSLFSFDGLIKTSTTFGFLNLTISYAIRYILIKVLIVLSPFAILCLSSNKTSAFFKAWLKYFLSLLFLQVFVAIILLICFVIDDKNEILPSSILNLGMIYTLFKANAFLKEFIGSFSTETQVSYPNVIAILKGMF